MANAVEIVNFALARLGAERIFSLNDTDTENARLAKIHYEQTVRSVLRSHPWNCCTDRETLPRLTEAPAFGYTYAYELPSDFLRASYVNDVNSLDNRDKWKIERDTLLSNDDTIALVYVYFEPDATQYDELLVEAISTLLASKLAAPITGKPRAGEVLLQEYTNMSFPKAVKVDAQEDSSNENHPLATMISRSNLVQERRRGF